MDIAALSMGMAQAELAQSVGTALTAKVMDQAELQGSEMIKMMEQSVNPDLGSSIDIKL